ncbi:complex I NDUFA9 subunit family protein [Sphingorhabdus arenilitoris]|uniref:Complex I NDUFA9 subunit family protein n=1 Tax=Sphingorhabdus arenilitoris TaxID=1490041 RepID=A0ABV8RCW5_9SPHN
MNNLDGKLITVLGGSGFLGRYVCQALLNAGARLRVTGQSAASGMHIKPLGNLGQVQLMAADVRKPASVARAVEGADMVVNLVGSFADMEAIQHIGARNVAEAAKKAKCAALVHISAIGSDADSTARYGRSKAAGEAAVKKAFADAIIFRPSIIFGREDEFINRFAGLIRMLPVVPIIGSDTKFQPVFVGDVARAVAAALNNPAPYAGQVLDLGGPEIFTMRGLNEWIAKAIGRSPLFIDVPDFAAQAMAVGTGWLPGAPITADQFKMLAYDNVVDEKRDGLAVMGIAPTSLDTAAHDWLDIYRKHGRFGGQAAA